MKDSDFSKLIRSIRQAGEIKAGLGKPGRVYRAYTASGIKSVRNKLRVSQSEFALMIGVSTGTVQNWEQGRREPEGPAKALLRVAERNPRAVLQALHY
jgi:putative transcriptional regulator